MTVRPVPGQVAEVAARQPHAVAVRDRGHALTYAELDEWVARVAADLTARGLGPGHVVGVCLARGVDLVVALLAVWRAGAAYLPVDPAHPVERIAYVLEDSGASLVLTDMASGPATASSTVDRMLLATAPGAGRMRSLASPAGLAYLMYTSGSTGRPKGVAVRHAAVSATLAGLAERPGMGAGDMLVAVTTAAFDISVVELFLPLVTGGTVVVADRDDATDPARLAGLLAGSGATVLQATPATWRLLLTGGWSPPPGFRVWCGGESMPPDLAARLSRTGVPVWDLYGPTETTIWSAVSRLGRDGTLTDWAELPGERVTVLGEDLAPAASGRVGDVYIAGCGLADGYAGQPGLTATRFVPAPGGARRYRTGDLGRVLPDGRVEILGRADHQVKINGHRVEPREIEARLVAHPRVRAAVVHPRTTPAGGTRLVGYLIGRAVAPDELRAHLRGLLPDYMVPAEFMWLAKFPLNSNGKVDRSALPDPARRSAPYVPPRTEDEAPVVRLCAEALGLDTLGTADDHVALGLDSLAAARLVSALREATGQAPSVADVLRVRTIGAIAALPRHSGSSIRDSMAGTATGPPLTTSGQRALWFLHQLAPDRDPYVEPWALRLRGPLDVAALRDRLRRVLVRHEPLRTRFPVVDGEPAPVLEPAPDEPLAVSTVESQRALADLFAAESKRPFDLEHGLPFRARLVRLADDDHHVLLVVVHHIACDGLSFDVLAMELMATSDGPLPVRFQDFAAWQRMWLASAEARAQLDHWQRALAGVDRLRLPTDRPRPEVRDGDGATVRFTVPADLVARLDELASAHGVTGFVLYLAAFQALQTRHARGRDVLVGTPVSGRPHPELTGLVGHFANTVVIRTGAAGNPTFAELLDRVRVAVLDALDHQDVPFDRVVERVAPDRVLGDNPLFDVSFTYTVAKVTTTRVAGAAAQPLPLPRRTAKFDLTLDLVRRPDGSVTGEFEYATDVYDHATVDRFAGRFLTLLASVADSPDRPVSDLPVLTDGETWDLAVFARGPESGASIALLHELVEAVTRTRPDATAVVGADGAAVTFRDLNAAANRLARLLVARGVVPEDVVGVVLPRGPALLTTLLAVLKAGAAYLPLDPADPPRRWAQLLSAAAARLVVTAPELPVMSDVDVPVVLVDDPAIAAEPGENLGLALPVGALAYVIFTSGSTGVPKGVQVEHRNAVNYVTWAREEYRSRRGAGAPLYSSMAFDLPVTSVWPVWAAGEPVTCGAGGRSAEDLVTLATRGGFGLVKLTPSHLAVLDQALAPAAVANAAHRLVVGGERLHGRMLAAWARHAPDTVVVNEYGPTETTVGCTWFAIRAGDVPAGVVPIGTPVANTTTRVLDAALRPVPVGVFGELWVGGAQVARGYRGAPGQTAERFVPDPYAATPGARMYRTGDVARFRADGVLEYAGRMDGQLKVRGYRIEPAEVEGTITAHAAVTAAAVVAPDGVLAAYVTPQTVDVAAVRAAVAERLPAHLVPARWVPLAVLPHTPSGKVDRAALPQVPRQAPVVRRGSPVESEVSAVLGELLGIGQPDLGENFFDLGGDSLLAIKAMSRLSERYRVSLT
ncbi:amino acid adenylation domain-containing protein, partial [Actinophytocola sp.]|uniref:amino acid adenylation domain-containing protein n=1 Tax=Actinophytocola sp. TaxID=1872138 RepID=UPI003D6A75D4